MKERQRWTAEEDALLRAYVKRYGPREWNHIAQRMNNSTFRRDAKSCIERWKNYLSPYVKKGSLTEEEQHLVIQLQAKHGNKWKKIANEIPGRTAKRLGKWFEVLKEKQQRLKEKSRSNVVDQIETRKYDGILEDFAEKLINTPFLMGPTPMFPAWLSSSNHDSPSVTLTLSPCGDRNRDVMLPGSPPASSVDGCFVYELAECCKELEEGYQALSTHKKETSWRLKRVELQLEAEKASRRKEKMEEIEAKIRALREEQVITLGRIDAEYKEQISCLRKDAEAKEQKLAEQWAAKQLRLSKILEQMQGYQWPSIDMNVH